MHKYFCVNDSQVKKHLTAANMEPFPRYVHPVIGVTMVTTPENPQNVTTESPQENFGGKAQIEEITVVPVVAVNNETSSPWMFGQVEDTIILPLILAFIALWCWLGNVLVIYSLLKKNTTRNGFSLMLINICVGDLVFISFSAPTAIVNHATYGALLEAPGAHLCKFVHYITFLTVYVAIYTTVVTCVFRYFGEYMSDKGKTVSYLSRGNALLSCVVIWIAFALSHINFLIQKEVAIFQEPFICIHSDILMEPAKLRTLWVTFLTCGFLLPLTAVGILSAITLSKQSHSEDRAAYPLNTQRSIYSDNLHQDLRKNRQRTLLIMATAISRTFCWVPIQLFVLVDVFGYAQNDTLYRKAEMLSVCIAFVGSCVNPMLYYCISQEVKNSMRETFVQLGCTGCEPVTSEDQGSDMNETIMSIISESSNHINYQ